MLSNLAVRDVETLIHPYTNLDAHRSAGPLVLERGRPVKDRVADVRRFDAGGPLDPESNYLFGEGGAGTFSDGKLTSRSGGPDVQRALEVLAECHGKPSVVYEHRPHLGSNRLPLVVRTLRPLRLTPSR